MNIVYRGWVLEPSGSAADETLYTAIKIGDEEDPPQIIGTRAALERIIDRIVSENLMQECAREYSREG